MTPEQHAKAIEDAAVAYAETTHTQDSYGARQGLKAAIRAGVGAAPEEWRLVPVEPTEDMRLAMATHGVKHLEWAGDVYAAMLAAAPKP